MTTPHVRPTPDARTRTFSMAVLTIRDAPRMTPAGRRRVAAWLQHQAEQLLQWHQEYARRYTARYLTRPSD